MRQILLTLTLLALCAPARAQTPVELTIDGRRYSLTLTPLDGGVGPNAPDALNVERDALGRVLVSWADKSSDETGFHIWRRNTGTGAPAWQRIATTTANVNAYTDHGALAGNSYVYRVQSFKDTGTSAFTPELTFAVATDTPEPLHPTTHAYTTPDGAPITALAPGDTLAIRGEAFGESGRVLVNFHPAPHRIWTPTTIIVRLPDTPMSYPPILTIERADGKYITSMLPWEWVERKVTR